MATLATALIEFADSGDSRTYTLPLHTVLAPRLLVQKRRVPSGKQVVAESSILLTYAVSDAQDVVLPQRLSTTVVTRAPILMKAGTGIEAVMLAHIRDVINSDEFAAMMSTQNWIKT